MTKQAKNAAVNKANHTEKKEINEKQETAKNNQQDKKQDQAASPLLERYLQKTMTDRMQEVDDEALAKAIKTLLSKDETKKHLN